MKRLPGAVIYPNGGVSCQIFMKWLTIWKWKNRVPCIWQILLTWLTVAAAAWELSDESSTIHIIFRKEESASIGGFCLKEEWIHVRPRRGGIAYSTDKSPRCSYHSSDMRGKLKSSRAMPGGGGWIEAWFISASNPISARPDPKDQIIKVRTILPPFTCLFPIAFSIILAL